MKNKILSNLSLSLVACAVLAGCGSDDKDQLPTVSVAASVALKENRSMTITATAADDDETLTYSWTQVSGPTLSLTNTTSANLGVTAPAVSADGTAVLRITVTDQGNQTASANVTVNIANNKVPTVTATFNSAAEKSQITLAATASDSDGQVTSYRWVQTSGAPVTLTGADSATPSFTAPSVKENTPLGFSVTVTDDDQDATTVEGTMTITPVLTTFNVTGTVAGSAFANATITGTLAGKTFSTTADASGAFSLPMQADDDDSNLFADIKASSVVTPGVEFYKFIPNLSKSSEVTPSSLVDSVSARVNSLFNTSSVVSASENPNEVSINEVSTALYSLIVAANGGKAPENLDSFTLVEKSISPDKLVEAAAVVKLITQGGSFALPEGVTSVLELLTNTQAYNSYVNAAEAAVPGVIASTITDIIADPKLTPPVDENSVARVYYEIYPTAEGFLSRGGNKFNFNTDGTGSEVYSSGVHQFEWRIAQGKIDITYSGETGVSSFPAIGAGSYGITQEERQLLTRYGYGTQLEVKTIPLTATLQRIVQGEKTDTYRVTTKGIRALVPITLPNNVVITGIPRDYETTEDQLMRNADKLGDVKFTAADFTDKWVFEHYYYAGNQGYGYAGMFADIFEINPDGTGVALENDLAFTWQLNDKGMLVVTFEDGSYTEIAKLDQVGKDVQVFSTSYNSAGNVVAADADYAFTLDGSDFSKYVATNSQDMYWQTTINQWSKSAWNGNTLLWDDGYAYFGWQFLENGSGYLLTDVQSSPPDFEPVLERPLSWQEQTLSEDESIFLINRSTCIDDSTKVCTQREWRLLKSNDGILGRRIYVLEVENRRNRSSSAWFVASGLGPRINMYEEIAFDYWNQNMVTETAGFGQLASSRLPFYKLPVQRTLVEPNEKTDLSL